MMKKWLKFIAFSLLLTSCRLTPSSSLSEPSISIDTSVNFDPTIDTSTLETRYNTFNNSFDDAQIPNQWPNYGIGDPFVYRFNGFYYLYPSTSQRGVRAYRSIDLMNWEPVTGEGLEYGYVLSPDYDESVVAYAPEVTYYDGWFYLCESQAGTGHYFFRSRSPEGPFVPYTGNVGESIDGSFFIDDDGKAYFLRAKAETIRIRRFNDDFTLSNEAFDIDNTSMGGWTEGPYVLKRNGIYYLTFTGVHVGSPGYKVGYSYLQDSDSVFNRYGYTRAENILMNTSEEWHTLGHSSSTMGPDMDSHYIAYHSRTSGVWGRHFNLSRLLFNGPEMTVDRPSLTDTLVPNMPVFYTHDPLNDMDFAGEFLLTAQKPRKTFTAEWNFIGNPTLVFGYEDSANYYVIETDGLNLKIVKVSNNVSSVVKAIKLDHQYDMTALHTIRLSHRDGNVNVTFDNMEKIRNLALDIPLGKIGYKGDSYEKHFTAFSNVAQGLSDQEYAKQRVLYANAYDENVSKLNASSLISINSDTEDENYNGKNNSYKLQLSGEEYATYKILTTNTDTYQITMRVDNASLGKKIALKVDNETPLEFVIPCVDTNAAFINVYLGNLDLVKGIHYLSVLNRENTAFSRIDFIPTKKQETVYENDLLSDKLDILSRGAPFTYTEDGLTSSASRGIAYLIKEGFDNTQISVDLRFDTPSSFYSSGIVVRAENDAFHPEWDDHNSLQGYYFGVKNTQAFLMKCDYQAMTQQLAINFAEVPSNEFVTLKVVANGNTLSFYVNGVEEFVVIDADAKYGGKLGLYTTGVTTTFKNLKVTPL